MNKKKSGAKIPAWLLIGSISLWGILLCTWMTQRLAAMFNYHQALEKPIGEAFDRLWYWPWKFLEWSEFAGKYEQTKAIFDQAYLVGLGVPLGLFVISVALKQGLKGREDLHGSAKWAVFEEIKTMGYLKGDGVYVGGFWEAIKEIHYYLRHNGPEHIMCFAPTRSGKGVGLIIPTLLAWIFSSVVLDIKGENFALTSGYLAECGHKVLRFDPSDVEGTSAAFNPLEEIRIDSAVAIPDVQQIASMVMDPEGKGLEDFWNKSGFGFFGGALLHCLIKTRYEQNRSANFYDVAIMLEDPARPVAELFQEMLNMDHATMLLKTFPHIWKMRVVRTNKEGEKTEEMVNRYTVKGEGEKRKLILTHIDGEKTGRDKKGNTVKIFGPKNNEFGESARTFIASAARGMAGRAENEMSGVVNTVTANLALYKDPVVAKNISRCDFRLDDLMNYKVPVNLYLVISPADVDRLRPLLRIFVTQLLGRLTEKMEFEDGASVANFKHRLLLMMDEFTSLGKLSIIERAIAYMAGYGIKGYFIVQDTKQLDKAYTKENAIMSNCHVRIAYAPNVIDTADFLSKMCGTTTVVDKKISISGGGGKGGKSRSTSISETSRPLLSPDECMRLPGLSKDETGKTIPGDMLIFTAGNPPIYGRQILYFLDPVFSERAKVKAPGVVDGYSRGLSHSLYFSMPLGTDNESDKVDQSPEAQPKNADAGTAESAPPDIADEYSKYLNQTDEN